MRVTIPMKGVMIIMKGVQTFVIIESRIDAVMFVSHGTIDVTVEVIRSIFSQNINSVVFPHPSPPRVMLTGKVMVIVTKVR